MEDPKANTYADEWDAGEMGCGGLLIHLSMKMKQLQPGQLFKADRARSWHRGRHAGMVPTHTPFADYSGPSCVRDATQGKLTI